MTVHSLPSGRLMPWHRCDGAGGSEAVPGMFTAAQLASLRRLEAEVSRSMGAADGAAATPRCGDPLIQLTEALIVALQRKRARRGAPARPSGQRRAPSAPGHHASQAAAGTSRLGDLLRDVERQLTARHVYGDRTASDRACAA